MMANFNANVDNHIIIFGSKRRRYSVLVRDVRVLSFRGIIYFAIVLAQSGNDCAAREQLPFPAC